jgi:ParB-like chromosome segregation protein Spo0J
MARQPLRELILYARKPRTHSDGQVAQIAASIREFAWTSPVLVDGASGIIAGHGRVLAAGSSDWSGTGDRARPHHAGLTPQRITMPFNG